MGIGSFLLGSKPSYTWLPGAENYFQQAFNLQAGKSQGEKYWNKGVLGAVKKGDYSGMPGIGMFQQQLANNNDTASRRIQSNIGLRDQPGLQERYQQLSQDRNQQTIGGQEMGYVGDQINQAAQGSEAAMGRRNQFQQNSMLGSLGMYRNLMYNQNERTGGQLGNILGGAATVGAAFAPHP